MNSSVRIDCWCSFFLFWIRNSFWEFVCVAFELSMSKFLMCMRISSWWSYKLRKWVESEGLWDFLRSLRKFSYCIENLRRHQLTRRMCKICILGQNPNWGFIAFHPGILERVYALWEVLVDERIGERRERRWSLKWSQTTGIGGVSRRLEGAFSLYLGK